jgi:hypothetical protein
MQMLWKEVALYTHLVEYLLIKRIDPYSPVTRASQEDRLLLDTNQDGLINHSGMGDRTFFIRSRIEPRVVKLTPCR